MLTVKSVAQAPPGSSDLSIAADQSIDASVNGTTLIMIFKKACILVWIGMIFLLQAIENPRYVPNASNYLCPGESVTH